MQPGAHVLATAFDAPAINGAGKDEPLIWTVAYGRGRVFHTALGHDVAARTAAGFVASFARGLEWVATGAVSGSPSAPDSRGGR
jgi:type 1 glutamine amidotransferase